MKTFKNLFFWGMAASFDSGMAFVVAYLFELPWYGFFICLFIIHVVDMGILYQILKYGQANYSHHDYFDHWPLFMITVALIIGVLLVKLNYIPMEYVLITLLLWSIHYLHDFIGASSSLPVLAPFSRQHYRLVFKQKKFHLLKEQPHINPNTWRRENFEQLSPELIAGILSAIIGAGCFLIKIFI